MKVLIVTQFAAHFHHMRSIVDALLERGHTVRLLLVNKKKHNKPYMAAIRAEARVNPRFSWGWALLRPHGTAARILYLSRSILNWRRQIAVSDQSRYYAERLRKELPPPVAWFCRLSGVEALVRTRAARSLLQRWERLIPPVPDVVADIRIFGPDAVIATPLTMRRNDQVADLEYLKAARALGTPTFFVVLSRDHLVTKGAFHVLPDWVLVWNESQVKDARRHHAVPKEKILICGAFPFDGGFRIAASPPRFSRDEICRHYRLSARSPFILYVGSSYSTTQDESWVVERLRQVFDEDPAARKIQILVRPHPSNVRPFERLVGPGIVQSPSRLPNLDSEELQRFYDSLRYAAAVVGINTSAMLDALVAERPVAAILLPHYNATQRDTQQFKELRKAGVMEMVHDIAQLPRHLARLVNTTEDCFADRRRAFINTYLRPRGFEASAGEQAARVIEGSVKNR